MIAVPGQIVLDQVLRLEPMRAKIRAAGARERSTVGKVERRRGAMGSKPLVAGTRVPSLRCSATSKRGSPLRRSLPHSQCSKRMTSRRYGAGAPHRNVRFFLDNDVDVAVAHALRRAGHDCWTAANAGLETGSDDDLTVYAYDHRAVLVTHDKEFSTRRRVNVIGHHIWLRCLEWDAAGVLLHPCVMSSSS
jgi:predicted nuclease of predicted toxin-antitoxin system